MRWLILLQLWRAIGGVFLIEMARGNLPGIFAVPAGWGGIAVAVLAAIVLVIFAAPKVIPAWAIHLTGIAGMIDFLSAFLFGFFSSATCLQLFSSDHPNLVSLLPTE